jgi:hypothetical protein
VQRAACRLFIGKVHKDKIVTRTRRNRWCVNPAHLQLVEEILLDYGHKIGCIAGAQDVGRIG